MHLATTVAADTRRASIDPGLRAYRLTAIDALRGLAIVLMAIDHTRDFFLLGTDIDPLADPNVGLAVFATRWITHFCAPVFVLLAGTSAGLMATRKSRAELARFLFTRGVWLIAVEIVVIATGWTFAPRGIAQFGGLTWTSLQVIWAIGASMVALAGQIGSSRLCAATTATPSAKQARRPSHWRPARATMLAPMAQITCRAVHVRPPTCAMPPGENVHAVAMMETSTRMSHAPRVTRKRANSPRVFLVAIRPALVPASSTKTGAQKCVIQRVANTTADTLGSASGSIAVPRRKKSRA